MGLAYLFVSFVASLAIFLTVLVESGSWLLAIGAYCATGILVLSGVLFAAFLRDCEEKSQLDGDLFPAE